MWRLQSRGGQDSIELSLDSLPAKCCWSILTAENAEVAEIYDEILSGLNGLRGKNKAATPKRETIAYLTTSKSAWSVANESAPTQMSKAAAS